MLQFRDFQRVGHDLEIENQQIGKKKKDEQNTKSSYGRELSQKNGQLRR